MASKIKFNLDGEKHRANASAFFSVLKNDDIYRRSLGRQINMDLVADPRTDLFGDLAADLFGSIFFNDSVKDDPHIKRIANHQIILWIEKDVPEWQSARDKGAGNVRLARAIAAAVWAEIMQNPFYQHLLEKQQELNEKIEQKEEAGIDPESDPEIQAGLKELQKIAGKIEELGTENIGNGNIAKIVQEETNGHEAMDRLAKSWGDEPGEINDLDATEFLEFYKKNPALAHLLLQSIGRSHGAATTLGNRFDVEWGETFDVDRTRDLVAAFPDQLVGLGPDNPPMVRAQAISNYFRNGLLGLVEKASGSKKGFLILLIDYSGSMNAPVVINGVSGPAYIAAGGTAIGLIMAAREAGREFWCMTFSSGWAGSKSHFNVLQNKDTWKDALDWVADFRGGGTPLDQALTKAMDFIDSVIDEQALVADLAVLTDGAAEVTDETKQRWRDIAEQTGSRLMDIGFDHDGALEEIRDVFVHVPDGPGAADGLDNVSRILGEWMNR